MLAIELAREDDVPAMLALSNWAAAHTSANFATAPEPLDDWLATWEATAAMYPWLVARAGDAIAGFAKASPHRARGAYAWTAEVSVYVDPTRHRTGVGRALYARLLPLLRAQGYVALLAGIVDGHQASEQLHAAFGFRRVGVFERVGWKHGAWHGVTYWQLELDTSGAPPTSITPVAQVFC